MIEGGLIQKLSSEWLVDEQSILQKCQESSVLAIGMAEVNSVFLMLVLGMGTAVLIFILELAFKFKVSISRNM